MIFSQLYDPLNHRQIDAQEVGEEQTSQRLGRHGHQAQRKSETHILLIILQTINKTRKLN
jgi:hypothetical protein